MALGIVAVVVGLGALVSLGERGVLARFAARAISHAVGGTNPADALLDVFLF